jgi:hypothetical protein
MLWRVTLSLAAVLALTVTGLVKAETPDPMCPGSTIERQAALAAAASPLWQVAAKKRGLCFTDRERVPINTASTTAEGKKD